MAGGLLPLLDGLFAAYCCVIILPLRLYERG
jgi:hypothetical protein